jgi:ABC-2 type transport system permease protein
LMAGRQGSMEVYWILRGAGVADTIPSMTVDGLIAATNNAISTYLIENDATLSASVVLSPTVMTQTTIFVDKEMSSITPAQIQSVMSTQSTIIPLAVAMIIMMAGGTIISSMGLEKENKTLETLLTLPVSRSSIIAGKLTASAIVGLLMAAVYMLGFSYYMSSLAGSSNVDLAQYGLGLGVTDYLLIGLSLFASLMAALSLCMVIGTFAGNYKSAQALTMPVTFLALIPMFINIFKDFGTLPLAGQVVMFGIPFSHPMMAFRSLMFDDYVFVLAGIAYSAIFALVMIGIAVWIFKTDRLLTGRMGKKAHKNGRKRGLANLLSR